MLSYENRGIICFGVSMTAQWVSKQLLVSFHGKCDDLIIFEII